jgi:uncharacterized membrane protein YGL010W
MKLLNLSLYGYIFGNIIPSLLKYNNFYIGLDGVEYYGEVHTTKLNSIIHSIFMPFTIYGMFLLIPKVILPKKYDNSYEYAYKINFFLYVTYMTHYISINKYIGLLTSIYYYIPLQLSRNQIEFKKGILISTTALTIQELLGHWLSGDDPSRLEAIPNAIIYAIYFSVSHFFD